MTALVQDQDGSEGNGEAWEQVGMEHKGDKVLCHRGTIEYSILEVKTKD